jgi:hypothetical protein
MKHAGLDDLREWLEGQRFKVQQWNAEDANLCNWLAYRPAAYGARSCEHNGKTAMLVVHPYLTTATNSASCEIEIVRRAGGAWYRLTAYAVRPHELVDQLDAIERRLVKAWNSFEVEEQK